MDIVAIVLGSLGFALSLCIAIFEIRRRYWKLVVFVNAVDILRETDNSSTVLFHLCFLNPSTEYKIVVYIGLRRLAELTVLDFVQRYNEDQTMTTYSLPNGEIIHNIVSDELILVPLDIPPLQSQRKICPFYFEWSETLERQYQNKPLEIWFFAEGIGHKNRIYSRPVEIPLKWLKDGGLHYIIE